MSKIEWCDKTVQVVAGCRKISKGCRHCYAIGFANRMPSNPTVSPARQATYRAVVGVDSNGHLNWNGNILTMPGGLAELEKEAKVKRRDGRPRRIFIQSMGDLFHSDVPYELITKVVAIVRRHPHNNFLMLTKRPERMRRIMTQIGVAIYRGFAPGPWPLPNLWLGVTCEDQEALDARIWDLLNTPAAVRFISNEPGLGLLDMTDRLGEWTNCPECGRNVAIDEDGCCVGCGNDAYRFGVDWVIIGGETGPGARAMHPQWARSLRDQCQEAGTAYFFKSWGDWAPINTWDDDYHKLCDKGLVRNIPAHNKAFPDECQTMAKIGKKHAGDVLDGRQYHMFPGERWA